MDAAFYFLYKITKDTNSYHITVWACNIATLLCGLKCGHFSFMSDEWRISATVNTIKPPHLCSADTVSPQRKAEDRHMIPALKGQCEWSKREFIFHEPTTRHFLYIPCTLARMGADHQFISISTGESKCNPADIVSICMSIYIHMTLRSNGRKWGRYDNVYLNLLTCLPFLYFSWLAVSLLPVFVSLYFKLHLRLFRTKHYDLLSLLHVQCH